MLLVRIHVVEAFLEAAAPGEGAWLHRRALWQSANSSRSL